MGPGFQVRVQVPEYESKFPSTGPSSRVRVNYKQNQYILYKSPILGQILDLISPAKIWAQIQIIRPMGNGKLSTMILFKNIKG